MAFKVTDMLDMAKSLLSRKTLGQGQNARIKQAADSATTKQPANLPDLDADITSDNGIGLSDVDSIVNNNLNTVTKRAIMQNNENPIIQSLGNVLGNKLNLGNDFSIGNLAGKGINVGGLANSAIDIWGNAIDDRKKEDTTYNLQQSIGNLATVFNPVVGMAYKGLSNLGTVLGTQANTYDALSKDYAGITWFEDKLNTLASLNPFAGGGIDKTKSFIKSEYTDRLSNPFSGSSQEIAAANDAGGKKYIFGRKKMNNWVDNAIDMNASLDSIGRTNDFLSTSAASTAQNLGSKEWMRYNGYGGNNSNIRISKDGMKLEFARNLLNSIKSNKSEEDVIKYQNGGSILVPDGALHKNRHHMEEENPELAEELTSKGIPIITTDENGEVQQVAEIEREEITLTLSLTKQVEKYWKSGTEDDMIKCGKLITKELLNNCEDNTGLINKVD